MNLTRRKPAISGGKDSIHFPLMECWNPIAKTAIFIAEVDKNRISCRVPLDILCARFGGSIDEPMRAVESNRTALHAAARARIEKGEIDADDSVLLGESDFPAE